MEDQVGFFELQSKQTLFALAARSLLKIWVISALLGFPAMILIQQIN